MEVGDCDPLVVAESDLVLTMPARIAKIFARSHGLRVLRTPIQFPPIALFQVWHQRRQQEPAHAWLRGMLAEVGRATRA